MRLLSVLLAVLQAAPAFAQNAAAPAVPATTLVLPAAAVPGGAVGAAGTGLPGAGALPSGDSALTVAAPQAMGPVTPSGVSAYGQMTGALARSQEDPGPVKRLWLVYGSEQELATVQEALAKVKAANPGVQVQLYPADQVLARAKEKGKTWDSSPQARQTVFDRLLKEEAGFVLATNQDLYEQFRGLRDSNLARHIPMGFAGRKFVSVDMPRASLDPAKLSDPAQYPSRRYLWLGEGSEKAARLLAGMEGVRKSLSDATLEGQAEPHAEEGGWLSQFGMQLAMKLAGQADSSAKAKLRERAHRLAGYLEANGIDAVATRDPEATRVLGIMKEMGYHKSLPVIWADREAPPDARAVSVALRAGEWQAKAPHVAVSPKASLGDALAFATQRLERVPENFMEIGGVSVKGFTPAVDQAVAKALPGAKAGSGRFDIHFMLTHGNGVAKPGDANPFGHFGMAVTDEQGKLQVWSVQYNDGGSFTGGLGDGKQMSLSEYLYSLWYLPGAVGQAIPLGETAAATVYDFVLRGADEAQIETMRRKAAEINARHLRGLDNYRFLNEEGMTNCISLVTQILRAAGYRLPETGKQDPAGMAYNMIVEMSRWLLSGRLPAEDFGLLVFERPAHSGPAHYRIPNIALAAPHSTRQKAWEQMNLWEKLKRIVGVGRNLRKALNVPDFLERFGAMASHRVVVGPNSRTPSVVENPESPVLKLRGARGKVAGLRRERVPLMEAVARIEDRIIKAIGFEGWQPNPAQSLEEQAREAKLEPEAKALLELDLQRHHQLDVALQLNRIDEQAELRRAEFLALQVADPTGRYARRTDPMRRAYAQVLSHRDRVETEDRVLSPAEIAELDRLNAKIERELEAVRLALLEDAGPTIPQSMTMILGQLDRETLEELRALSQAREGGKGKAGEGSGK